MGKKTKIDWCDSTWNPVTGCLHGCEYCYARRIAERFKPKAGQLIQCDAWNPVAGVFHTHAHLAEPSPFGLVGKGICSYPLGFTPTFHRYRLDEPQRWKKPRTIFACSMADLFGDWVPDKWIREVFEACDKGAQHRYLFLTKNPKRYAELSVKGIKPPANSWIGTSATTDAEAIERTLALSECWNVNASWFVSVEPILEKMSSKALEVLSSMEWIIIGAETGNRKDKIVPEKSWVDKIVAECDKFETPVFMKESLRELMGDDFRQEFPWEV